MKSALNLVGALAALTVPAMVCAAPADPAAARIEAFDRAVVDIMKQGATLGVRGRLRKFEPVIEDAFDLPLMTRFAVGPSWTSLSETDRQSLVRAFSRLTAASYAHNFDRFSGERFELTGAVQTRGPDKIVQTKLYASDRAPVDLTYRMRQSGGQWKIVDVYYGAISQLTTRRSDFAAPLASGGAKGLIAHLDEATAKLLK